MTTTPYRRDEGLSAAMQLGWRLAELYALVDDTGDPADDTLLPSHGSLERGDQLELQLRAAAGDARRAGIASVEGSLPELLEQAVAAPGDAIAAEAFRTRLRCCHIEVQKDLWAADEALGKAYELGNGLSDTYGRICRAYRHDEVADDAAWRSVFGRERIERVKKLLDDLESRLEPSCVAVVRAQLDSWCCEVDRRLEHGVPELAAVRCGLRRQTVIWRQLLTGDKSAEAYLDRHARGELRDDLRRLIWQRYSRWLLPLGAVLLALVLALPFLIGVYEDGLVKTGLASVVVAAAGAFGITRASVLFTVRGRLDQWSQLLWDRAVAQRVYHETLTLGEVLPALPAPRGAPARRASALARRLRGAVAVRGAAATS
jgi:hypothetical protein